MPSASHDPRGPAQSRQRSGIGLPRRGHGRGRAARRVTRGPKHHYFGYIGRSRTIPWNADGRYVLALQTPFQDRLPGANDPADVCLLDTRNGYVVTGIAPDGTRQMFLLELKL